MVGGRCRFAGPGQGIQHPAHLSRCRPGLYEFQLESLFRHELLAKGAARRTAFLPVFASGPNCAKLRYSQSGEGTEWGLGAGEGRGIGPTSPEAAACLPWLRKEEGGLFPGIATAGSRGGGHRGLDANPCMPGVLSSGQKPAHA